MYFLVGFKEVDFKIWSILYVKLFDMDIVRYLFRIKKNGKFIKLCY